MAGSSKDKRPPTVLVVDDALDMRIFLRTLLETAGFQPLLARDGTQGLELARKQPPHLVLLDIMMPGQGGAAMYKTLKADPRLCRVPVLVLSAVDRASFQHYLKMLRAEDPDSIPDPEDYMEKPPDPHLLLDRIRSLCPSP